MIAVQKDFIQCLDAALLNDREEAQTHHFLSYQHDRPVEKIVITFNVPSPQPVGKQSGNIVWIILTF